MLARLHKSNTLITVLSVACLTLLGAAALAQGPGGPGGPRGGFFGGPMMRGGGSILMVPMPILKQQLGLSSSQETQLNNIRKDMQQEMQSLRPQRPQNGQRPDMQTMRANFEKMRTMMEDYNKKAMAVLTPEQQKKAPQVVKLVDDSNTVGIPAEVLPQLKLSEDQIKHIESIADDAQKQMQTAFQNARQNNDFSSIRQTMMQTRTTAHNNALTVLTTNQITILNNYLKNHPQGMRGFGGRRGGQQPGGNN
jgi:hypothetical protein